MPVTLEDELLPNSYRCMWNSMILQNSLGFLWHSSWPQHPRPTWGILLQETSRLIKENIRESDVQTPREWLFTGPLFSLLSLLASSRQLSCPIRYTLAAFTHVQNTKPKLPLYGMNQIPSIYKQQPNRQASVYNLQFSASCTRIEMCSYFPVTQIATSKREW